MFFNSGLPAHQTKNNGFLAQVDAGAMAKINGK
jgi:hypothetical protein